MCLRNISISVLLCALLTSSVFSQSLWRKAEMMHKDTNMYGDSKAREVGDIVTIVISENANLTRKAKRATSKETSIDGKIKSLLFPPATALTSTDAVTNGLEYTGTRGGMHNGKLPVFTWGTKNKFKGGGEMDNEDSFTAKITAIVKDVLPNGNLMVEGTKQVFMSEENQTIHIAGIIRPQDIALDNTVSSRYIANAKIYFQGKGPIKQNEKRGVLTYLWDLFGIL